MSSTQRYIQRRTRSLRQNSTGSRDCVIGGVDLQGSSDTLSRVLDYSEPAEGLDGYDVK
jgi:hypothetical protein